MRPDLYSALLGEERIHNDAPLFRKGALGRAMEGECFERSSDGMARACVELGGLQADPEVRPKLRSREDRISTFILSGRQP